MSQTNNDLGKMFVCIDGLRDGNQYGRIFNCFSDEIHFSNLADMILKIDNLCDELQYPQSSMEERTYKKEEKQKIPNTIEERIALERKASLPGEKYNVKDLKEQIYRETENSFLIWIKFRQEATLRGTLQYRRKGRERRFEFINTLELLRYIVRCLPRNMK